VSNDNVVKPIQPGVLTDRLSEVLRDGARALLTQAVEAEVSEFLAASADLKTDDGCRRVVRHGHLPERDPDRRRACGRAPAARARPGGGRRRSGAHPVHAGNPDALRPAFEEPRYTDPGPLPERRVERRLAPALAALLGKNAPGLSATTTRG
jgi:putative transposase